jgi:phosphatidylserine/phosphatidylglycerophosphate/cardiolipin synthase-like enzyme
MKRLYFVIFFSIVSHFLFCNRSKEDLQDPSQILGLLLPEKSKFYFAFPGRDVPEESKYQVRKRLVTLISQAKERIDGYIYSMDDMDVLIALRAAKQRGVIISIQGDREEDYKEAEEFGIVINRWRGSGIHHTKIWIFDKEKVFWGTGNFTTAGITRDNNVFWEEEIKPAEYQNLLSILREEDPFGILTIGNRQVFFAPEAGLMIQERLLNSIRLAKSNIRYMIFTHFDPLVSYELTRACQRGVKVEGIYNDPVNMEGKILSKFLPYPCKIYADGNVDVLFKNGSYYGGLLHHKTMIIDASKVIVGSYNYTVSARDDNREFLTEFDDLITVNDFLGEWNRVRLLAKEISSGEEEEAKEYKTYQLISSFENELLLGSKSSNGINFDKNSSGLSLELNRSFNFVGMIPSSEFIDFDRSRARHGSFQMPSSMSTFIQDSKPAGNFTIVNYWDYVKVQLTGINGLQSIAVWDGKKAPFFFERDAKGNFPVAFLNLLKSEQWIVFLTSQGNFTACSIRKNEQPSRWILYLQQLQILKGRGTKQCQSF